MAKRDRRFEIMQAAEKLFTRRRFHEVTLDHVVEEAGVGKGTIYRYFRDKDDLFFQIATGGFDELCDLLAERTAARQPFADRLLETCRRISAFFARRRQWFGMMQSEDAHIRWCGSDLRTRWMQRRKKLVCAVADILRAGQGGGQVRRDVPADVLATYLLGLLRARARDLADAPESWQRLELVVGFFCDGAKPGSKARMA